MRKRILRQIVFGIAAATLAAAPTLAEPIGDVTLADGNSAMTFVSGTGINEHTGESYEYNGWWTGEESWRVDGIPVSYTSKMCYRDNAMFDDPDFDWDSDSRVQSDNLYPLLNVEAWDVSDTNGDGNHDRFSITYNDGTLKINQTYALRGDAAGSGRSEVTHTTTYENISGTEKDLTAFQIQNFDIGIESIESGGTVDDWTDDYALIIADQNLAKIWDDEAEVTISMDEMAHYWIAWNKGCANFYFKKLGVPGETDLPQISSFVPDGTGNTKFVFQWNFTLADGETFELSNTYESSPVPVPGSMLLFGAGIAGLTAIHRRKR